jgi:DNA-binding SARP family transcriptional activator
VSDQIEIRLLGRLWVCLGNGQAVPGAQWTTGKTTDLLRLLAVSSNQVVSSASLIEKLWPDSPRAKATASLRTATSQIRKTLGRHSVTTHLSGLQLQDCWVDVVAHRTLSAEVGIAMRTRDFARVIATTKEAEALYVDDFHAYHDDTAWAEEIRDNLKAERKLMLADAAESAIELGWMRDAIELSTIAISLDSCFERAHRALMRAYAGIGETDSAVRSYERCRRNLLSELDATPSSQTTALHRQLLTTVPVETQGSPFVGRESNIAELSAAIRDCARGDGTGVVCLIGSPGSGRESLLEAAVDRLPKTHLRPVRPPKVARQAPGQRMTPSTGLTDVAVMGPVDSPPARAHVAIAEVLATVPAQAGRVLVIVTSPEAAELLAAHNDSSYQPRIVESPTMDDADLRALAQMILAGPPSPELVTALQSRSTSLAGAAVEILRAWVSTGQIISTVRGLGLVSSSSSSTINPAASATFRVMAEQLDAPYVEICQILAVLDHRATALEVMEILGSERRTERRRLEIQDRMDHLTDRGILTMIDATYVFRDRTTQDLFELWLRPSLQARIVRRIDDRKLELEPLAVAVGGDGAGSIPFVERRSSSRGRRATDLR